MTSGLCNPEYYRGTLFGNSKIYGGERRRYGVARRNNLITRIPY